MLIIPNVVIKDREFEFTYEYDSTHDNRLRVMAVGNTGGEFHFDISNINLLTKCAIIELVYQKAEECLQ